MHSFADGEMCMHTYTEEERYINKFIGNEISKHKFILGVVLTYIFLFSGTEPRIFRFIELRGAKEADMVALGPSPVFA